MPVNRKVELLMLMLITMELSAGAGPSDHRRKVSSRRLWTTIQTDVEELLPLPSYNHDPMVQPTALQNSYAAGDLELNLYLTPPQKNMDAEAAEDSVTIRSASKIELLRQLLRLAPEAIQEGSYDKCNHPFHSWMCQKPVVRTTPPPEDLEPETIPEAPKATILAPETSTVALLLPEASNFAEDQIIVQMITTTTAPPKPYTRRTSGWDGVDPCTHPFHSWLCTNPKPKPSTLAPTTTTVHPLLPPPEEFRRPEASNVAENQLIIERTTTTTTEPPRPYTRRTSGWDGVDPCTHPFHSWLCAKPTPKPSTLAPTTTSEPPLPPPPEEFRRPEASNVAEDQFIFETITTTTEPSKPYTRRTSGWDGVDPCTHPFHSWLCAKPTPKPSTLAPTTTTEPPLPPPPEEFRRPEASNVAEDQFIFETITTTTEPPKPYTRRTSVWDGVDPCTHPFQSWLCAKPKPKPSTLAPTTTTEPPLPPPPEESRLPEASNVAEDQFIFETITTTTEPSKPYTRRTSGWDGVDPCTHPFHSWLCAKPRATTIRPTPQPVDPSFPLEPAPSNQEGNQLMPDTIPRPALNLPKSAWDGGNPCSHPFHSWMCNGSSSRRSERLRIGRQSALSVGVVDNHDDVINDWASFESKRIRALRPVF